GCWPSGMTGHGVLESTSNPQPEHHHRIEHNQGLPKRHMSEFEQWKAVLTNVKQADKPSEIGNLNSDRAEQTTFDPGHPGCREGKDRCPENNHDLDSIAAVLQLDRKTMDRFRHDHALRFDAPSEKTDQAR